MVRLGFGVTTFRDTILELIGIFLWITLFVSPMIYGYYKADGYGSIHLLQAYEGRSLGNLGYSQVKCSLMPVSINNIYANCEYGTIGEIIDFGVSNQNDGNPFD